MAELSAQNNGIRPEMYAEYKVNRGFAIFRERGVVTGLTEISSIKAKEVAPDGSEIPCRGELRYRGIDVRELVQGFLKDRRLGFEETVYLCSFPNFPTPLSSRASARPFPAIAVCQPLSCGT